MGCAVGHRHSSDLMLLLLWHRLAATAMIRTPSLGASTCCRCGPEKKRKIAQGWALRDLCIKISELPYKPQKKSHESIWGHVSEWKLYQSPVPALMNPYQHSSMKDSPLLPDYWTQVRLLTCLSEDGPPLDSWAPNTWSYIWGASFWDQDWGLPC